MKTPITLNGKNILVTGSPGFIGANLVLRLLRELEGGTVVSLDNMNDYYEVSLKEWRLKRIEQAAAASPVRHVFVRGSLGDRTLLEELFEKYRFDVVVNLAAQAGVRWSIDHPDVYIESNIIGFYNLLEACRHHPVEHLVYASSSSVYGGNKKVPFSTDDKVDNPVSLYAATKKSDELLAHAYSKLYNIPATGLRFFTVYGPAGRPDMFYYSATKKLAAGESIRIFNYGDMQRDFTYIDDIVEGILRVMQGAPERANGEDGLPIPPYAVYNIGGGQPENLLDFVATLQEELVRAGVLPADYDFAAHRELVGMQPGDVPVTYADRCRGRFLPYYRRKAVDDLLLGLRLGEAQGHELDDLVARDLADGGLVHQGGVDVVGLQLRDGQDAGLVHDDGVALGMAGAEGVAHDAGAVELPALLLGHRAGDHVGAGIVAVELDGVAALGPLVAVGQQALVHHEARVLFELCDRVALGVVHALDLHHLHLDAAALADIDLGAGVHDALAAAGALAVVLLDVFDLGVFADVEAVYAVVGGVLIAAVGDAAAGDDDHVAVVADEEVVVHDLLQPALGEDDGDVDALVLRAGLDADVDAGLVGLGGDLDIGGGVAPGGLAVGADVIGALGHLVQIGDFRQKLLLDLGQHCSRLPPEYGCR